GFDAQVQLALVAGGGILLDHADLHGTIDQGESSRKQVRGGLCVLGSDRLAHAADLVPEAAPVLPVEFRLAFGLADPLERGKSICHRVNRILTELSKFYGSARQEQRQMS